MFALPISIIESLKSHNLELAKYLLTKNSFKFFTYCFKKSFKNNSEGQVIVQTKGFLKNNAEIVKSIITEFEEQVIKSESNNDIEFLSFMLKFIILDPNLSRDLQTKFVTSLLVISSKNILEDIHMNMNMQAEAIDRFYNRIEFSLNCLQ